MNGLLTILLIADRHTTGIENVWRAVHMARRNADEHDIMVVANGCSPDVYNQISLELTAMDNAKLVKLAAETDPDSAILEGLQRAIGDSVFVGSVRDASIDLVPAMLDMAADGHEVVLAQPCVRGTAYALNRLDYGSRLMSRAAVHFVMHAGSSQKSAYHLLPSNALFAPAVITFDAEDKPRESRVRGLRRRWRAMISSQVAPLRFVSGMALFGASANIAYSLYIVAIYVLNEGVAPGWATLSLQSAGMNMLFSITLFVLCEYLVNIFRANHINQQVRVEREIRSKTVTFDRENLERA